MDIEGELVEDPGEMGDHIHVPLFEGVPHRPQHPTGVSPGIRLRPEADLASHDCGPQVAFGKVVLGRHPPVVGPVIEAIRMGPNDLLEAMDA